MFFGRKEELLVLANQFASDKQENIIIYGRRRIGKSELIKEALKNTTKKYIFYQAKETTIEDNVKSIGTKVSDFFGLGPITFDSLEDILEFLFNQNEELIFVIDEYPYLVNLIKGLDSIIQKSIDKYKHKSKLKLVLLGSYIDIMSKLNHSDNPLYGRISTMMFISEMNYQESSLFYSEVDLETKVKYFSVFGGVPYYNALIDETKSFEENLMNIIISKNSPLSDYIEMTLSKELRKINNANAIFQTIARGISKFSDILSNHVTSISSSQLSHILKDLIEMDLIKKTTPINEQSNSRRTYYQINDNFIDFFYRYIYKNQTERLMMDNLDFYNEFIKEDFETKFIPKKFEEIALQYLIIKNKERKITPPLYQVGKYWYDNPKEKINGEFDLVTKDKNGYTIYEVKYTNTKINERVISKLTNQLEKCNVNYHNLGFVSKSGFDIEEKEYNLITIEDLYDF